jgi:hypothetical protein
MKINIFRCEVVPNYKSLKVVDFLLVIGVMN